MRVDKAGKPSAKEIVDRQYRAFLQMQNLAGRTIGVDHVPAALQKHVARQRFEKRALLGSEYGNFSF